MKCTPNLGQFILSSYPGLKTVLNRDQSINFRLICLVLK